MEKYIVQAFVGEGSFGRVFKAKHKDDNSVVALKVIRKKGRSANDLKNLRQECDIQRQLKHPNIIQMIDSFDTEGELVVVTEFAEKELHSILGKEGCLSEDRTQNITWDLVSALYYLHSHRVLHRDLKPQNVLIDSDGHAKLCDFGLARNMTAATHVLTSIKGTPLYMAPELIDEKPYDHHADLWSLGCIVYELMAGQPPYCTTSIVKLVQMIRHKPVQWPTFISPNAFTFLQGLLHKDPNRRFTWPDLLNHPFVAGHVLILPEDQQSDSPFTRPLSESQMEAKQMQKDKINHIQRLTAQATKSDRRDREHRIVQHDCIPLSDDDSVRATSAFSVRDSLKTDDEDLSTVMSPSNAKLLAHEYKVMNNSNLVICNLENNLAQFATKNEKCEIKNIPEETKDELDKSSPEKVDKSNDKNVSSSKGSKKSKEITELASQSMKNPKSSINSGSDVSSGLSKSVPPSYKQKILQFSRDKLRFGSGGNKLTRSIKRSFTFNRSWDKNKSEGHRRISEPNVELQRISISKEERDKDIEKCELVDDSTSEKEINNDDSKSFNDAEAEPSSIEQEEWLAFLKSSILEVMEGDVDSLIQLNMVEMLMRWTCGGPSVCQSVSTLLSLPTVCPDVPRHISLQIQDVYLEAKVLHHFVHAIKRLTRDRNDICEEKVNAVSSMLELCACLCVRSFQAVQQLVLAVYSHKAIQTFYWLMTIYSKAPRIVLNTVGLLITILQDLPEHSELVEKILFGDVILDLPVMLTYQNDILKIRICILISLLCNFCCTAFSDAMSNKWDTENCEYLESLQTHCNVTLNRAAKNAYKELSIMPFFVTQV